MPPRAPTSRGSLRRVLIAAFVVVLVLGGYGFVELGAFLAAEDPLQKGDAILALAGTTMTRQLEAADLYLAGYTRHIVLSREPSDGGELALERRGIHFTPTVERVRAVFLELGIPNESIIIPDRIHNSTAAEAITLRELSAARGWRRVIVVSSKYHLRRAGFAFRRELRGTGVGVVMRGSRYDTADPERWWQRRSDLRDVFPEVPKLIAYVLGLGA
ncbi:MAG: YdcF family protein [Acidobacteria bacterium]|nr:YdcF family protein [Acidobacteriota bacterium]